MKQYHFFNSYTLSTHVMKTPIATLKEKTMVDMRASPIKLVSRCKAQPFHWWIRWKSLGNFEESSLTREQIG